MREGGLVSALIWLNLSVSAALAEHIIHLPQYVPYRISALGIPVSSLFNLDCHKQIKLDYVRPSVGRSVQHMAHDKEKSRLPHGTDSKICLFHFPKYFVMAL